MYMEEILMTSPIVLSRTDARCLATGRINEQLKKPGAQRPLLHPIGFLLRPSLQANDFARCTSPWTGSLAA